ncbi:hypothetical protein San01_50470 [Streptomyces angustmyceticus]|uniref:Uncharacterized protein n=1 Tax=Streptomyces angustmyceticus TaxID=285578 RepID=A0A5J4LLU9_9ACTN|nr:hypothetical protein San01_50470 [Streptomyces angustmyceticus]
MEGHRPGTYTLPVVGAPAKRPCHKHPLTTVRTLRPRPRSGAFACPHALGRCDTDVLDGECSPTPPPGAGEPRLALRLIYAGRLTPEKGGQALTRALAGAPGIELSIAAPRAQIHALAPLLRRQVSGLATWGG